MFFGYMKLAATTQKDVGVFPKDYKQYWSTHSMVNILYAYNMDSQRHMDNKKQEQEFVAG